MCWFEEKTKARKTGFWQTKRKRPTINFLLDEAAKNRNFFNCLMKQENQGRSKNTVVWIRCDGESHKIHLRSRNIVSITCWSTPLWIQPSHIWWVAEMHENVFVAMILGSTVTICRLHASLQWAHRPGGPRFLPWPLLPTTGKSQVCTARVVRFEMTADRGTGGDKVFFSRNFHCRSVSRNHRLNNRYSSIGSTPLWIQPCQSWRDSHIRWVAEMPANCTHWYCRESGSGYSSSTAKY